MATEDMARFWPKIDNQSPFLGCWTWTSCTNPAGYGVFRYHGAARLAHRVAWVFFRGPIQNGLCVLHQCDNPRCVNPAHLFLGTQADNVRDMDKKARRVSRPLFGDAHPRARLTSAAVVRIRSLYETGLGQKEIGSRLGVSQSTVSRVLRGAGWNHVTT